MTSPTVIRQRDLFRIVLTTRDTASSPRRRGRLRYCGSKSRWDVNGPGTALIQSCKLKKLAKSPFAGEMQIYNFKGRIDLIS